MKYIAPFELDEKEYEVGFIDPQGEIAISKLQRKQFPSKVVTSHANVLLNKGYIKNFTCFYTDVQCWVPNFDINLTKNEKLRYTLSKEHVSCSHIANQLGLTHLANGVDNIVMSSSYLNHKMGHIPLVLKLWLKKKLKSCDYSKTEMTLHNAHRIFNHLINLQNLFSKNGLFPWQPQTFAEKIAQQKNQKIYDEMLTVDRHFLHIRGLKNSFEWLNEYDPSWIEKFIV